MDFYYNELSEFPYCHTKNEMSVRVERYALLLKAINNNIEGGNRIRYEDGIGNVMLDESTSLATYCRSSDNRLKAETALVVSMAIKPYLDDESQADGYTNATVMTEDGEKTCFGLFYAYLNGSCAVSFASSKQWSDNFFHLQLESRNKHKTKKEICSLSSQDDFANIQVIKWIAKNIKLKIPKSSKEASEKECHLREDHGRDVLSKHFDKMRNFPFVEKCVNSLPFQPNAKAYIGKIKKVGLVEIVLNKTSKGLGLVVKTTARNLLETYRCAYILEEELAGKQ